MKVLHSWVCPEVSYWLEKPKTPTEIQTDAPDHLRRLFLIQVSSNPIFQ